MKSKKGFQKCFLGIALMLLLCLLPISADAASVQLNKTNLKLSIGKTYTLKIKGTKAKAKWSSTKKSVATVSSKGVVKAKAPGKAKIKAKVNKKTYTCNVTVNADAKIKSLKFQTVDKGTFIQGSSNAEISFSLGNPSVNVAVSVKSSSGSVVYKKTIKSCKANKTYNIVWNGKRNGKAVAPGTYTAVVKAGSIQKSSPGLIVRKNEFAGGTGSKTNPFRVATLKQFLAVAKYNGCYFKQTANIDGKGVEKISGIYSEDNPFNGTYDGNGFVIKNIIMQDSSKTKMALFGGVGEKGTLKKITLEKIDLLGTEESGVLFCANNGKVSHCIVKDCYITGTAAAGMLGWRNNEKGFVTNCTVSGGSIHLTRRGDVFAGGLLVDNFGSLIDSKANAVSLLGTLEGWWNGVSVLRLGGIVRWNTGKLSNCGAINCSMTAENFLGDAHVRTAGICELNEGNISNCYSSGCTAKADGVYENKGIVR